MCLRCQKASAHDRVQEACWLQLQSYYLFIYFRISSSRNQKRDGEKLLQLN